MFNKFFAKLAGYDQQSQTMVEDKFRQNQEQEKSLSDERLQRRKEQMVEQQKPEDIEPPKAEQPSDPQ